MYSEQVLDHFQNPRNVTEIGKADAVAEIENPACGDVLWLALKLNAGRIAQVQFKAKGCVAAIACGSAMTELVNGKSLEDARKLSAGGSDCSRRWPPAGFYARCPSGHGRSCN